LPPQQGGARAHAHEDILADIFRATQHLDAGP
jgi:hypothetical protein